MNRREFIKLFGLMAVSAVIVAIGGVGYALVNGGTKDFDILRGHGFTDEDIANLKFFANIPPGVEDMEGKTLEKIKAATGSE